MAGALGEIAEQAKVGIRLNEARIPLSEEVKDACEILGLDPLYVANEGKVLAVVSANRPEAVLAAVHAQPLVQDAAIVGEVVKDHPGMVTMKTRGRKQSGRRHALG